MKIAGDNIKALRQKKGWNQSQAAERLGISIPALSKIEAGITDINLSRLKQLATLYEVEQMDIITIPGQSPQNILQNRVKELEELLSVSNAEIIKLQRKIIDLYDEFKV